MSDDFASMFTYRGSLKETDVIDISDDEDEILEESFEAFDSKKKRKPTSFIVNNDHTKKIKNSYDSSQNSIESKNSISLDDDDDDENEDENSYNVNNNNKNNNNNNNNNSNSTNSNINRPEIYSIEDDEDEVEFTAPPVYTKSSVSNFIKQQQPLQTTTTTTTNTTNNTTTTPNKINNSNYYYGGGGGGISSPSNNINNLSYGSSSPQVVKKINDQIPLIIKCAGEPNEKIVFYYDSPLQKLINLYCSKKNLDVNTAQFKLYGLMLDSNKTPRELDLLDDDTLEVGIKINKPINLPIINNDTPTTTTTTTDTSASIPVDDGSPKVLLQVRYESVAHKFKIGMSDPFSKLVMALTKKLDLKIPAGKKIVFKFDGAVLNPNSTPEDEDMEDDFQIDAFLK